jgi:hypothetical protein
MQILFAMAFSFNLVVQNYKIHLFIGSYLFRNSSVKICQKTISAEIVFYKIDPWY